MLEGVDEGQILEHAETIAATFAPASAE